MFYEIKSQGFRFNSYSYRQKKESWNYCSLDLLRKERNPTALIKMEDKNKNKYQNWTMRHWTFQSGFKEKK